MKQKTFSILLTLLMSMVANVTLAYDAEIDGIYYDFSRTEATVTFGDNKYTGDIVIPGTVTYNEMEYSVECIGSYAFYGCSSLTSISIPTGVTRISTAAFENCSGLTSITIPYGVTSIDMSAFYGCSGLTSISIPNSVTSIGSCAFMGCSSLLSITIPNGVTSIQGFTFDGCSSLTSILIPNSVTSIEGSAFSGCRGVTSIKIGNGVTSIGKYAFDHSALERIEVDEGNAVYDSRNNCNAIIETASNTLICGCKNTIIPNGVSSIGLCAFYGNSGLSSITIPNSVTSIGERAFTYCRGLTSVTIPNSVTDIGYGAFSQCSGLTFIKIPGSVTTIGKSAFSNCRSLTDVYCYAETVPTTESNAFSDTPIYDVTLHVPEVSIDAYKTIGPWSNFKEIVVSDYLNVEDLSINAGESNTQEISLSNDHKNFVAFQMDLTLPEGIGIDKTGCTLSSRITDENQKLTIGKLESGAYRITSTSLSLKPISGNDGALLNLKLTAEDGCIGGEAILSNIIFSTDESEKIVMSDKTFDISILYDLTYKVDGEEYKTSNVAYGTTIIPEAEPTKKGYTFAGWSEIPETMPNHDVEITGNFYLYGDVNTDEEVDVVDVVDIARFVVATPSANFREKLADLNFDKTVNIADAVTLVNFIAGDQNFSRMMTSSRESYDYDLCQLQLLSNGTNALSFCLDGAADFTAFQFEVELPENTDITAMSINGQRMDNHQLLYNKVGENRYRVAALSLSNAVFKGNAGELLNISIDGLNTNEVSVQNIHFVTKNGTDITFDALALSGIVTGIANVRSDESDNVIFDLQGRKLSKTQRGVNIVNGKKVVLK